ncbi:neutral zinc metallopeptidase [Rhodobacterales bacterium HKCCE3408]|nr:neutral zinc metallopeptidase [Rhodobacterales bacterium HKCCE3408]
MADWTDTEAPSLEDFETLAEAALLALPPQYAVPARQLAIRVEDFASDAMLAEVGLDDPFDLTGLYDGIPLTEKSVMDQPTGPDAIWLFRRPILEEWVDRGDVPLGALVAHVLVHELAHHFGWSDDDIATIDEWWL